MIGGESLNVEDRERERGVEMYLRETLGVLSLIPRLIEAKRRRGTSSSSIKGGRGLCGTACLIPLPPAPT